MMTVKQVSELTGVSIRTLRYYDSIGLLSPADHSESGYRLYDDADLEKLQQILLFRELEFPLKDIVRIVSSPDFDRSKALEQQIELLELKRQHLDDLITFARGIKLLGVNYAVKKNKNDFSVFDKSKLDEYSRRAKQQWENSPIYKEFAEKSSKRTEDEEISLAQRTMELFTEFGAMRDRDPADDEVQVQVKKLQEFFCENFYNCTNEILSGLGKMYAGGGEFTENIDKAGGKGTAEFVNRAIEIYCGNIEPFEP